MIRSVRGLLVNDFLVALLVYSIRDGFLVGALIWLVVRLSTHTTPAPSVRVPTDVPATGPKRIPTPVHVEPPPVVAGKKPDLRFTVTATSFAGSNDSVSSRTGAYDGKIINGDTELAAALSYHFPGRPPAIRVFYQPTGRSVDNIPVRDVGPWNTNDRYWETSAHPASETQYANRTKAQNGRVPTNPAGLDLSPAVWRALGYVGDPQQAQGKVSWDFVDATAAPPVVTGTAVPTHLALMRRYRDLAVHAQHDSTYIMSWPAAIAAKYPDMAEYCKGYVHDSTPWCGLTVADVLAEGGIRPQFGAADTERFLWAASWLQFGTAVDKPQPGDIMVFQWAGGGHHVTLYDHEEPADDFYHCTGGNQGSGHEVSTEAMPIKNCIGIRRPLQP